MIAIEFLLLYCIVSVLFRHQFSSVLDVGTLSIFRVEGMKIFKSFGFRIPYHKKSSVSWSQTGRSCLLIGRNFYEFESSLNLSIDAWIFAKE